jgi:uncharacterized repeat protein (TIGR03806 family)
MLFRYRQVGQTFTREGVFADLRGFVSRAWGTTTTYELGFLSAAFHPDFPSDPRVFVYYTARGSQASYASLARLSQFRSLDGGLTLDPSSEQILLTVEHTTEFHRGGGMSFGPDGYLYLALGDGNIKATSQNLADLRGKLLRVDINRGFPYSIPPDNPFVATAGARPEVFAFGFRNPWRWSFHIDTGELWVGDVGESSWEEVDLINRGGNYGWPLREGMHCRPGVSACSIPDAINPVYEYDHSEGAAAVIGGYVYRGAAIPELRGTYVFGDASRGELWGLSFDGSGTPTARLLATTGGVITAISEGADGELFVLQYGPQYGRIWSVGRKATAPADTFPKKLSQTGCVDSVDHTKPAPGVIPYTVNMPLWSDGAAKERWMGLPPAGKIKVGADGDWEFPIGTVLVKHFRLDGKLVETRLFMRHDDGDWAGYSYEWNDEQTDATLLPGAKNKTVGTHQWLFPSRSQCLQCHTEAAGRSLGLETAQLNGLMFYPQTGRSANQLATLAYLGLFETPLPDPSTLPAFPSPLDMSKSIDRRARAYLHANCSICHRPEGPGQGPQDFRYQLTGAQMNIYNVAPTQGDFGIAGAKLYAPGHPERSLISHRVHTLATGRMPPLASRVVDELGASILDDWIRSGLGFGVADSDGDGLADNVDNCPFASNPDQRDSDADGFGNRCDADLNNDGIVNPLDLGLFKQRFGSADADADFNGDGIVNPLDLGIFKLLFGKAPGAR